MKVSDWMKGLTWLFLINFLVLQWSGWRLARVIDNESNEQVGWTWVYFPVMSGWHWG